MFSWNITPELDDEALAHIRRVFDGFVSNVPQPEKKPEPRLPRKALLSILEDRAIVNGVCTKRPYSMVKLVAHYNDVEYQGVGFSKVCYPDVYDVEDGIDIARRRAILDIYHQIRDREKEDA